MKEQIHLAQHNSIPPKWESEPYVCPVCGGTGRVQSGFYNQYGGTWPGTSTEPETCRTCDRTGIVWGLHDGRSSLLPKLATNT